MLQIDKIIAAIDKLKSPFSVVDVMTMERIERTTDDGQSRLTVGLERKHIPNGVMMPWIERWQCFLK